MRTVKFVCLTRSRDRNDARAERAVGFAQSIANDLLGFFLKAHFAHTDTLFTVRDSFCSLAVCVRISRSFS